MIYRYNNINIILSKVFIATLFWLLPWGVNAQNVLDIDSLKKDADNAPDSIKANKYCNICWNLRNHDPETALMYAKKALECAEKVANETQVIHSLSYMGVCYRNLGSYGAAFDVYNEGLERALKAGVKDQAAYSYINIGNLYLYHDDFASADSSLLKALEIGVEIKDSSILAYTNLNLGRVNLGLKRNKEASKYLRKALEIRQRRGEDPNSIIIVKKYLGDAAYGDSIFDEAMQYYMAILPKKDDKIIDYDLLSDAYNRISSIHLYHNQFDSALYYGNKCLDAALKRNINIRIKDANKRLGDVYLKMGDLKTAMQYYNVVMQYADTFLLHFKSYGISNYEIKLSKMKKDGEVALLRQEQKTRVWITISMGAFLVIFFAAIIILYRNNINKRRVNTLLKNQNDEIEARNVQISYQRDILQKQQKEITDSIVYAKRIQFAMIPDRDILREFFADGFVFHIPRDVVSGDFWWTFSDSNYFILVCADCTGHGVPGAFMSMLGVSSLNEVIIRDGIRDAADIMNNLRELVKKTVNKNLSGGEKLQDGMDAALIVVDKKKNILDYSGANIPFLCYRHGEEIIIRPTHNPIGVFVEEIPFVSHKFNLEKGDRIYLSSDGYKSQFGGPKDTVLKSSGYKKILRSIQSEDMVSQCKIIKENFYAWKGDKNQTDDVLVIGMEV